MMPHEKRRGGYILTASYFLFFIGPNHTKVNSALKVLYIKLLGLPIPVSIENFHEGSSLFSRAPHFPRQQNILIRHLLATTPGCLKNGFQSLSSSLEAAPGVFTGGSFATAATSEKATQQVAII